MGAERLISVLRALDRATLRSLMLKFGHVKSAPKAIFGA